MGKGGFGGRTGQLPDWMKIVKTTIASLSEGFIRIGGLDECYPKNRSELLEPLREIVMSSPTTWESLSGRPHFEDEIEEYFTSTIMIAAIPTTRDIERYL